MSTGLGAQRRTVRIQGRGAERRSPAPRTQARSRAGGVYPRHTPDRVVLWAVILGVMLVLVAAMSAHAAALRHVTTSGHGAQQAAARIRSQSTSPRAKELRRAGNYGAPTSR